MEKTSIDAQLAFPSEGIPYESATGCEIEASARNKRILQPVKTAQTGRHNRFANSQMEARLLASMQKIAKEFQGLYTLSLNLR